MGSHTPLLTLRVSKVSAIGRQPPDSSSRSPGADAARLTSDQDHDATPTGSRFGLAN